MKLEESKTFLNLAKAYAGECQAHIRYKFIEYGARMEGYEALAEVVDKLVYNEFHHARMFYTFIQNNVTDQIDNIDICSGYPFKEKWDLEENLRLAAEDEYNEATKVYPTYAKIARDEGFEDIAKLFELVVGVEECHHKMFTNLYKQFKDKTMYKKEKAVKWKCAQCGHEETSKTAFKKCPLCNAKQGWVMLHLADN